MLNVAERSHTEYNVSEPGVLDRDFERDFELVIRYRLRTKLDERTVASKRAISSAQWL